MKQTGVLIEVDRGQKRVRIVDVMTRLQNRFASSVDIKNIPFFIVKTLAVP